MNGVQFHMTPLFLHAEDMAAALGFKRKFLQDHRELLIAHGAKYHEGRWHVATTENAMLECIHLGLLGRTNPKRQQQNNLAAKAGGRKSSDPTSDTFRPAAGEGASSSRRQGS